MFDFAKVLDIDVYQLSKIYNKMVKDMHLKVKYNDPSLYVPRFLK